jgi:hypothetical protein
MAGPSRADPPVCQCGTAKRLTDFKPGLRMTGVCNVRDVKSSHVSPFVAAAVHGPLGGTVWQQHCFEAQIETQTLARWNAPLFSTSRRLTPAGPSGKKRPARPPCRGMGLVGHQQCYTPERDTQRLRGIHHPPIWRTFCSFAMVRPPVCPTGHHQPCNATRACELTSVCRALRVDLADEAGDHRRASGASPGAVLVAPRVEARLDAPQDAADPPDVESAVADQGA